MYLSVTLHTIHTSCIMRAGPEHMLNVLHLDTLVSRLTLYSDLVICKTQYDNVSNDGVIKVMFPLFVLTSRSLLLHV